MPTIFEKDGFRFFFYSNDHRPIHVHVRKSRGEAVFDVESAVELRESHGLKVADLSKAQQSSDWGADQLSADQLAYAASDVLNLHALKERLDIMLVREGRDHLAAACFGFLPHRAALDLAGWEDADIFAHT